METLAKSQLGKIAASALACALASSLAAQPAIEDVQLPSKANAGDKVFCVVKARPSAPGASVKLCFAGAEEWLPGGMEWIEAGKSSKTMKEDPSASGGFCSSSKEPWTTLFRGKAPDDGKPRQVWCRFKGSSIFMKGAQGDKWSHVPAGDSYVWTRLGEICSSDKNAGAFEIVKSGEKSESSLDCVLLSGDPAYAPSPRLKTQPGVFEWQTDASAIGVRKIAVKAKDDGGEDMREAQIEILPPKGLAGGEGAEFSSGLELLELPAKNCVQGASRPWLDFLSKDKGGGVSVKALGGFKFPVSGGFVALRHAKDKSLPERVEIPVGRKAGGLLILHAEFWQAELGAKVCSYNVVYEDGGSVEIPVREEQEISGSARNAVPSKAFFVDTLYSKACMAFNIALLPWRNPHPEKTVSRIVFSNANGENRADENSMIPLNVRSDASQLLLGLATVSSQEAEKLCSKLEQEKGSGAEGELCATVNFLEAMGPISPLLFGTNETNALSMDAPGLEAYRDLFGRLGFPIVRLHGPHFLDEIFPESLAKPDYSKIEASLREMRKAAPGCKIMLCVNHLPAYVDAQKPEGRELLASLCEELAKRLQADGLQPEYWEIFNECYFNGADADRSLWKAYNLIAPKLRAAAPSAKIGGFAPCWPFIDLIKDFYKHCGENVDFISWHKYPTGSAETSDSYLMAQTPSFEKDCVQIREALLAAGAKKLPELALTEYNINWNWKPHDPRQANWKGAAWMASVLLHLVKGGADIATSWHARGGGTFGLVDERDDVRPAGHWLHLAARHVKGEWCMSQGDGRAIECLAFKSKGAFGFYVVNKSQATVKTKISVLNAPDAAPDELDGDTEVYSFKEQGLSRTRVSFPFHDGLCHEIELAPFETRLYVAD